MGRFFKIASSLSKFWKNRAVLLKIWSKIRSIGILTGRFFLEKLVFVWVYFQISRRHLLTQTKLEHHVLPPHPGRISIDIPRFSLLIQYYKVGIHIFFFFKFWFRLHFRHNFDIISIISSRPTEKLWNKDTHIDEFFTSYSKIFDLWHTWRETILEHRW